MAFLKIPLVHQQLLFKMDTYKAILYEKQP